MQTMAAPGITGTVSLLPGRKRHRIESIDLLRGIVMIIMALDHVRDYFHKDAFLYEPTDLSRTNVLLFFTRFITHFCAPIFILLAGVSAYLAGMRKTKKELAFYLFTRGLWLIFAELFLISLGRTFNPTFSYVNLQVIWAIGVCMIVLSGLIFLNTRVILAIGLILVGAHNFLDNIHPTGSVAISFLWCVLHEPSKFHFGNILVYVHYPLLPWIGRIAIGYCLGRLYSPDYDEEKRKKTLLFLGLISLLLFLILRSTNLYGDAATWSVQKNMVFSFLSFLNVTKYPPSLLYVLITTGPGLIFLAFAEKPLNRFTKLLTVYGRVPFFYYVVHIYLIHLFAMTAAYLSDFHLSDMILYDSVNHVSQLKNYGFTLLIVYIVWIGLVCILYPLCKWFDNYKRIYQHSKSWLTYV